MNTTDKKIADTLAKFGEPVAGNVWRVQGTAVIYHKALERIAAVAGITFLPPQLVRAERDECIILVTGQYGKRTEWSIGEALIGVNYRVSGKQAAYVYAMAEKRAKDRVILKLIELHGLVYSEEEADEFKNRADRSDTAENSNQIQGRQNGSETNARANDQQGPDPEAEIKGKITKAKSINAVTELMLHADTLRQLEQLPVGIRDEVRDFAKARLVELGWPTKAKAEARKAEPDAKVSAPAEQPDASTGEISPEEGAALDQLDADVAADALATDGGLVKLARKVNSWTTPTALEAFLAQKNVGLALKGFSQENERLARIYIERKRRQLEPHTGDASRREPERQIVSDNPKHPTNLVTLPNRIATAIASARTVERMEEIIEQVLAEAEVAWDDIPEATQDKINEVADKKASAIKKSA